MYVTFTNRNIEGHAKKNSTYKEWQTCTVSFLRMYVVLL